MSDRVVRRRWSLQTRLIVTVTSIVALILIAVGLATGTALQGILRDNLDASVTEASNRVHVSPDTSAADALELGRQEIGTLLVVRNLNGLSGAYVDDDGDVVELTDAEMADTVGSIGADGWGDVTIGGVNEYRVYMSGGPSQLFQLVGMPTSEVTATVAQILTTVALMTGGGLLLLSAIIAMVIRHSLRPLRVVAATATRVAAIPLSQGDVRIEERVPAAEADARTELGQVGAALNTLLDHVDSSLAARARNEERMRAFVADASHELRTPLASIRGYSELSLRALSQANAGAVSAESAAEHTEQSLERIQAQSLRMTTLVEDLLLLARLDEGTELVYGAVDLTRIVIDGVADAQVARRDHDWVLEVPDEPVVVAADTGRLHQVLTNLLANAATHTPAGTTVTVSLHRDDARAVLRVHDDGPGIDPAVADALFERFARADVSRARKTGGTGLGLSIAKAIVEAHDGTITVDSSPGDTTFRVELPARPLDPPAVD